MASHLAALGKWKVRFDIWAGVAGLLVWGLGFGVVVWGVGAHLKGRVGKWTD